MQVVLANMIEMFEVSKMGGSYPLLFLLALCIINGENHVRAEWNKEGEFHERIRKNKWISWYGALVTILIVCNPIWQIMLTMVFPTLGSYENIPKLIPYGLVIPYGIAVLQDKASDKKKKQILMWSCIILIGLAGSGYGMTSERMLVENMSFIPDAEKEVLDYMRKELPEESLILADESIITYGKKYSGHIKFLYGKDLWTPGLDLGIMDAYAPEMMDLYLAMQNPKDCMNDIMEMATLYGCQTLVVKEYDGYHKTVGNYQLQEAINGYLVYYME